MISKTRLAFYKFPGWLCRKLDTTFKPVTDKPGTVNHLNDEFSKTTVMYCFPSGNWFWFR